MRAEIEPNFKIAKERYEKVLAEIFAYADYCDKYGDEDRQMYEKLRKAIKEISGKNADDFSIYEFWEADGAQNIAFDIALPEPNIVSDITKAELDEILERIREFKKYEFDDEFLDAFYHRTTSPGGYFYKFLELNFSKNYDFGLFIRHKQNGEWVEYSKDEIAQILWSK